MNSIVALNRDSAALIRPFEEVRFPANLIGEPYSEFQALPVWAKLEDFFKMCSILPFYTICTFEDKKQLIKINARNKEIPVNIKRINPS